MRTAVFALFLGVFTACSLGDTHPSRSAPYDLGPRDTASDLAIKIRNGEVSAEDALLAYLARIDANDRQGANLQSIIALNPNALAEARRLDREARAGQFRGRLHGVPVLVKDNIETKELPTTAGSMALLANDTGRDAPIVARLRAEGAIILGKTNLSEWANFRSNRSISGWSAVGGLTRNPHSLDRSACGSSSGSGAAIAANFAPLALGTETNGSITCPAAMTGTVGFKPTIGLLPRTHIVPLSPVQDSAGPMTRTVRDAALMLTIMAGTDADDPATKLADEKRIDYVEALERDLTGLRIGVFRWAEGDRPAISSAFSEAVAVLEKEGATLVDISEFEPDPVMWMSGDTVLRTEFKHALNAYLADTAPAVTVRSLNDLIAFNLEQADRELALFDQSILIESADAPALDDPDHILTSAAILKAARANGIDKLLLEHDVDVLVMPSTGPASLVDTAFTTRRAGGPVGAGWLAAMAGYPVLSVPMGEDQGLPLGLMIMGTAWDDATLLAVGHAYQQAADKTIAPRFPENAFDTGPILRPLTPGVPWK